MISSHRTAVERDPNPKLPMSAVVPTESNKSLLLAQLVQQAKKQLTGQLDVHAANGNTWSIFFCVGRLIWATHHGHEVRALRLHLAQHCPTIDFETLSIREADKFFSWDYQVIWVLEKRKTISIEQAGQTIRETILDCFFEMLQAEQQSSLQFKVLQHEALNMLRMQIVALNVAAIAKKTQAQLIAWREAQLQGLSPADIPVIKDRDSLEKNVPAKVFQQLIRRVDGQKSLRELAHAMDIDLVRLSRSLLVYIRKGWVTLIPASDIPRPTPPPVKTNQQSQGEDRRRSLIACVDDSPQVCELMEAIITEAGYRFIGISDSVRALPILLEKRPSLIFLDLVMPVANGYEVCTQLRRMSIFNSTPIVILTGNDGVVDRVRAKMVKASEFLSKPVEKDKVLSTIERLLQNVNA